MSRLARIVAAIGGEVYDQGRRACVPGPGHSRADRSVSLLLEGDRIIVHSFAGQDWREVAGWLEGLGLIEPGAPSAPPPPHPAEGRSRAGREAVARALWAAGRPVEGTLAERHLRLRCVRRPATAALRFHPGVPSAVYEDRGGRRPALLAAIRDAEGVLRGVELTYLAPDGRLARARTPRKAIGSAPRGSAIRLHAPGEILLVAEGVVTALSASEAFALPAWALRSAHNLHGWRPPPGVRRVVVAGDRGCVGEAAGRALTARLLAGGLEARLALPPESYGDWNEAAADAARAGRRPLDRV